MLQLLRDLLLVSNVAGLKHKPVKDLMGTLRILRIVLPDKNHLVHVWLVINALVVEEIFGFAFGGKKFNCCLFLSLYLLLCWSLLLLGLASKSLVQVRKLVFCDHASRVEFNHIKVELGGGNIYRRGPAQIHLLH